MNPEGQGSESASLDERLPTQTFGAGEGRVEDIGFEADLAELPGLADALRVLSWIHAQGETKAGEPESSRLSVEALERINRICLGFERALKKGESPRIEDYVLNAQGEERSQLLRELLLLDYRSRSAARDTS